MRVVRCGPSDTSQGEQLFVFPMNAARIRSEFGVCGVQRVDRSLPAGSGDRLRTNRTVIGRSARSGERLVRWAHGQTVHRKRSSSRARSRAPQAGPGHVTLETFDDDDASRPSLVRTSAAADAAASATAAIVAVAAWPSASCCPRLSSSGSTRRSRSPRRSGPGARGVRSCPNSTDPRATARRRADSSRMERDDVARHVRAVNAGICAAPGGCGL